MIKTSKIKEIKEVKEWSNDYGTFYQHLTEMLNGDKIEISKKKKYEPGQELTYEIVGDVGQHEYTKAKSAQKPQDQAKKDDYVKGIEAGHAINNAVNLICAGADLDLLDGKEPRNMEHRIFLVAQKVHLIAQTLKEKI